MSPLRLQHPESKRRTTESGRLPFLRLAVLALALSVLGAGAVAPRSESAVATLEAPGPVVAAWGFNTYGQTNVPAGLTGVTAIAAGGTGFVPAGHSLALKSDGTVVAWGSDTFGQASVPTTLSAVTAIAAGGLHSLALKSDGTVVGWGNGGYGQTNPPAAATGVTAIAAGFGHSLALKGDGTVVAWGAPFDGQTNVPSGLSGVTAIAAGGYHSLALKSDGTVVAWGYPPVVTVPTGLSGVTAIAAGEYHSLALKGDGSVVAWGANQYGQSHVPAGLSGVIAIAAGNAHSLALKGDGTLVGWGQIAYVPTGLTNVTEIAAGGTHNLALFVDTTPPVVHVPTGLVAEATSSAGAVIQFTAAASDVSPPNPTVSCTPASGSVFSMGHTSVECTATDSSGNEATASFTVTVVDTAPPSITAPGDITIEATSAQGAVVIYSASAQDLVDGSVSVGCSPPSGSTFALGTHTVACTAIDSTGNSASASFQVAVVDTTPPALEVPGDITKDATGETGVAVVFDTKAEDIVDGTLLVTCTPASGDVFPINQPGESTPVTCTATDAAGNTASAGFSVYVKGAPEQVTDLIALVDTLPLDGKLGTSLHDKLVTVQRFLAADKPRQAEDNLASFINQVDAQRGKGLTGAQADALKTAALRIMNVIVT